MKPYTPQFSSKYGFSGLFEVGCKFINQLLKVKGFLWPHILKIVQFWDFDHNLLHFGPFLTLNGGCIQDLTEGYASMGVG